MDKLQVTFFICADVEPFICAVNGKCTIAALEEIEKDINECHDDMNEAGNYTFECAWFAGQYDELGRCEQAPGWELNMIKFEPMECDHG
ncbi:Uncharacterised protein [Serratia fonticola]|uniref:hypothetical protein n=1 Tax=Serratia fonticola TaxID=47917 RepID=UPI002178B3EB|nr:hypothetical protein [Serratia fonticola]CAI1768244.1 Uncharacterised protein [Serratia fonticola]